VGTATRFGGGLQAGDGAAALVAAGSGIKCHFCDLWQLVRVAKSQEFGGQIESMSAPSPVFIVGGSRTGSEMLKTMLSISPKLDFVDEIFLLCPWWLHSDLDRNIRRHVGDLAEAGALDRLMNLMYSGKPYGWLWTAIDQEVDRDLLFAELAKSELSLRAIFDALMRVHAKTRGKSGIGAKFPLHYSYTNTLVDWFPSCRIIHTTRNPKAVYASQAAKYIQANDGLIGRNYKRSLQFVHINIQTAWTARLHRQMKDVPNYRLLRYEDVVNNPETELRQLCDFLQVPFLDAMLNPHQYGSSFDKIGASRGVDNSSLERWRKTISPWTARLIDVLQKAPGRNLGYR